MKCNATFDGPQSWKPVVTRAAVKGERGQRESLLRAGLVLVGVPIAFAALLLLLELVSGKGKAGEFFFTLFLFGIPSAVVGSGFLLVYLATCSKARRRSEP